MPITAQRADRSAGPASPGSPNHSASKADQTTWGRDQGNTDDSAGTIWWALLLVLCVHGAAVVGLIGTTTLGGDQPVIDFDLAIHYHRAEVLREGTRWFGPTWDPSFMGGADVGGATDADNRLGELGVRLLRFLPPGQAWNATLLLLFLLAPILFHCSARWSGAGGPTALLATGLAVLLFWSTRFHGREFLTWGMYGWVVASAAAPLLFAGLQRLLARPTALSAMGYGVATAWCGLAHALSACLMPLVLLLLSTRVATLDLRRFMALAGATLLATGLLFPAALPLFAATSDVQQSAVDLARYFQADRQGLLLLLFRPERALPNAILLLALLALFARSTRLASRELALAALLLAGLAVGGQQIGLPASLQPTRFLLPALFLAAIPAGELLATRLKKGGAGGRPLIALLLLTLALPHLHTLAAAAAGRHPLTTVPNRAALGLEQHLARTSPAGTRILIEDDGAPWFGGDHFGAPHFVAALARRLDRQLIGGPHPVTASRVGSVTFVDGRLLGRALREYADAELSELLTAYNVGSIATWSERARARFVGLGLHPVDLPGGFAVFQFEMSPGFASSGPAQSPARARASLDRIEVSGARGSPTLLRWQFDPRFEADPPLPIRARPSPYSPVGFIEVDNGDTSEFVLRFRP